jgi:hypothetical protein
MLQFIMKSIKAASPERELLTEKFIIADSDRFKLAASFITCVCIDFPETLSHE